MSNVHSASVYRIRSADEKTWNVFQDASAKPLASFEDKNAAVTYAMCLARGKVSWQTLLDESGQGQIAPDNAILKVASHV